MWNTLYIKAGLDQLTGEGYSIQPEDLARRFPLVFERIGLYCLRLVATGICKTRVTLTRFCVPFIQHPNSPEYSQSKNNPGMARPGQVASDLISIL